MKIPIVELHFSNRCTGYCAICSRAHGHDSDPLCSPETFEKIVEGLRGIDFGVLQLGGDGDSFLNPHFLDYVRTLKKEFPGVPRTLFTNGLLLTPERSDQIIGEQLINNIETRIDTLDPTLFWQSTGLDLHTIIFNLIYFMKHNNFTKNYIIYFPLFLYRDCVKEVLNKEPTHLCVDESRLKNEDQNVRDFFSSLAKPESFGFRVSEVCLWGEREDVKQRSSPCSQLERAFKNQIYIYPNGNIGLCPFDDGQDTFILGNVWTDDLAEVWSGEKRSGVIEDIRGLKYAGRGCCIDPLACDAYNPYRDRGYAV